MITQDGRTEGPDDRLDVEGERDLLDAVRNGSSGAYAVLYGRHRSAAKAYAERLVRSDSGIEAEDVVELAFTRCYSALRNGNGPDDTLRYYLLASIRNEVWRIRRRRRREVEALDRWSADEGAGSPIDHDPSDRRVDALSSQVLMGSVFRGLPERWRHVLWLTEVEGRDTTEVATLLSMTPNAVSALAYRARLGLRLAFIDANQRGEDRGECRDLAPRIAAYMASRHREEGDFADVHAHLDGCSLCRDLVRGVDAPDVALGALVPLGLLSTARWFRSSAAGGGSGGGLLARRRAQVAAAVVAGALIASLVAVAVVASRSAPPRQDAAPSRSSSGASVSPRASSGGGGGGGGGGGAPASDPTVPHPPAPGEGALPGSPDGTQTSGSVAGRVTTSQRTGAARGLEAVPVELVGSKTGERLHAVTDQHGRWSGTDLPPGSYQVFVLVPVGFLPDDPPAPRPRAGSVWRVRVGSVEVLPGETAEVRTRLTARHVLDLAGGAAEVAQAGEATEVTWDVRLRTIPEPVTGVVLRLDVRHPAGLRSLGADGLDCTWSPIDRTHTAAVCRGVDVGAATRTIRVRAVLAPGATGAVTARVVATGPEHVEGATLDGDPITVSAR